MSGVQEEERSDGGCSTRRRPQWARRLLIGPALFFVALSLSFTGNQTAAQAYAKPPTPVTVGTVLRSPGARLLTVGAATGPLGIALTAGSIALLAYQTKDSWWPVLEGALYGDQAEDLGGAIPGGTGEPGSCNFQGALSLSDEYPNRVYGTFSKSGCGLSTSGSVYAYATDVVCRAADGNLLPTKPTDGAGFSGPDGNVLPTGRSGSGYGTASFCGSGETLASIKVYAQLNSGGLRTATVHLTRGFAKEDTSVVTTVQCKSPDGTLNTIEETEFGQGDRVHVPSCAERFPGSIPWSGSIKAGLPGATREVQSWDTKQDVYDEWADCFGPSGLQCVIKVWVDGQPCQIGDAKCIAWETLSRDEPERVECKFGTHVVPVGECRPLRKAYDPAVAPREITKTKPDGSPDYADEPAAEPGTGTGAFPRTGDNPADVPATNPETNPEGQSCWGQGWSWNPVSWVYVPTKCALKWAFVPRADVLQARTEGIKTDFDLSTPGRWIGELSGFTLSGGETASCEGPTFTVHFFEDDLTVQPFAACEGLMATAAGMTRLFLTVATTIGGGMAAVRAIGSGLGWNPGVGGGSS